MPPDIAIDILRHALWVLVTVASPVLLPVLAVGLIVGILQAATSVNEAVLSLVPKLVVTAVALAMFGTFMIASLMTFFSELAVRIADIGG